MTQLSSFQKKCVELMNAAPRTHATHCFRSALYHLERAESLRAADPAMAIFRAITAEEEAASGVMRCLIEMKYPGADALNPHDHTHKHAVFPFLQILQLFFGQTFASHFTKYNLHIKEEDGATRLTLALNVMIDGEPQLAYPLPPLNFDITSANTGEAVDYSFQINQLVAAKGKATVKAFLRSEANLRNEILYAGPNGYPRIRSLDVGFLTERHRRVLAMINLYLLIFPYEQHQPFVTQALASFVNMLRQLRRSSSVEPMETQELHRGRLIDHIQLVVRDLAASKTFYEAVFGALNIPIGGAADDYFWADELFVSTATSVAAQGKLTGRGHLAFQAQDRAMVDAFYAAALANGGKDNGAPGERPYHPGYYAAFVLDPDGNNIEAVYHGEATRSSASVRITF